VFDELEARLKEILDRIRGTEAGTAAPPGNGRIIREVMDPAFLARQLAAIRATAGQQPGGNRLPAQAYEEASAELARAAPDVPFMPRSAINSQLQSILTTCIESRAEELLRAVPEGLERIAQAVLTDEEIFRQFGPCDPRWMETKLAEGWAMIEGRPDFPDTPAPPVRLASDARIVVVGDWGTGLPGAQAVAQQMRRWMDAGRGREQHVVHLGDVYYSGWREEYETRFLPYWPVQRDDSGVLSWALNGNHDMYSGGHGYFGFLLRDPRFRGHWRDDPAKSVPSSYFSIENDQWQILGLDSGYADHDLAGTQQRWLAEKLQTGRRTMLLSHHQPFSGYDGVVGQLMTDKVRAAVPPERPLDAWIWGHEHRCTIYADSPKPYLRFGACIGNGGVPQALPDPPLSAPPAPDDPQHAALTWAYDADELAAGTNWLRFGFAVLDFDAADVKITFVDEHGSEIRSVTIG